MADENMIINFESLPFHYKNADVEHIYSKLPEIRGERTLVVSTET